MFISKKELQEKFKLEEIDSTTRDLMSKIYDFLKLHPDPFTIEELTKELKMKHSDRLRRTLDTMAVARIKDEGRYYYTPPHTLCELYDERLKLLKPEEPKLERIRKLLI